MVGTHILNSQREEVLPTLNIGFFSFLFFLFALLVSSGECKRGKVVCGVNCVDY